MSHRKVLRNERVNRGGVCAAGVLVATAGAALAGPPAYTLTILPLPPGMRETWGYGVNNAGHVAGQMNPSSAPYEAHGFFYDGVTVLDLGSFSSGPTSLAHPTNLGSNCFGPAAINDSDVIVGRWEVAGRERAFRWENGVRTELLRDTSNQQDLAWALAINAAGQIAGVHTFQCNPSANPAWAALWEPSTVNVVSIGPDASCGATGAYAVNDGGLAGGSSYIVVESNLYERPTLFTGSSQIDLGTFTSLKENGRVYGLNGAGDACGVSGTQGTSRLDPCLWTSGSIVKLNASGWGASAQGRAYALNGCRQVVGTMYTGAVYTAFYWEDGVMYKLDDLIAPGSGWRLTDAHAISDMGHITGVAYPTAGGFPRAFLLSRCLADYNRDGFVTGDDFDQFVIDFDLGLPMADVDCNSFVSGDDFDVFVVRFIDGC